MLTSTATVNIEMPWMRLVDAIAGCFHLIFDGHWSDVFTSITDDQLLVFGSAAMGWTPNIWRKHEN